VSPPRQHFTGPAAPVISSGCALVTAELLQQLQKEVGKLPSFAVPPGIAANAPADRDRPDVDDAASPKPPKRNANVLGRGRVAKGEGPAGPQPQATHVKHAFVGTDDGDALGDTPPPPPGARHASVGTTNGAEEGTQTVEDSATQETHFSARPANLGAAPSSPSKPGGLITSPTSRHLQAVMHVPGLPPVPIAESVLLGIPTPQAPLSQRAGDSPHGYGRCDLFAADRLTAERDRDRKRAQAQMLADQIEERRQRKIEEKRQIQEQDLLEEIRIQRERKEIEERQQWESQARKAASAAAEAVVADAPARQKDVQSPAGHNTRRRRATQDGDAESVSPNVRAGAFRGTATEADSTTGLWNSEETEERRRRRRRRRAADTAGGNGATWRTTTTATEREQKRSWRDPQADSLTMNADDTLTTVVEGGRETKREAKEARRRRRIRRVDSTVADSQAGAEPWAPAQLRTLEDEVARRGLWPRSEEEEDSPAGRRRGAGRSRRPRAGSDEEQAATASVIALELDRPSPQLRRPPAQMSDEDLRDQIGSLVRVCKQLLRERAEERASERPQRNPSPRVSGRSRAPQSLDKNSPRGPSPQPQLDDWHNPPVHRIVQPSHQHQHHHIPLGEAYIPASGSRATGAPDNYNSGRNHAGQGNVARSAYGHQNGNDSFDVLGSIREGENGTIPSRVTNQSPDLDWGTDRPSIGGEPWPTDALVELLKVPLIAAGAMSIPGAAEAPPLERRAGPPVAARGEHYRLNDGRPMHAADPALPPSLFASPCARGLALRRGSGGAGGGLGFRSPGGDVFGSGMGAGHWGGQMVASPPPPMSRGGLNVQANWFGPGLGPTSPSGGQHQGGLEGFFPPSSQEHGPAGASEARRPGQFPTGIKPSIQAQSAMLREMYPNGAQGAGIPGPLALP